MYYENIQSRQEKKDNCISKRAKIGVINWPSKDIWIEMTLKREFKTVAQTITFKKKIKKLVMQMGQELNPEIKAICCTSNLEQTALDKTKINIVKIDATVFSSKNMNSVNDIDLEIIQKYLAIIDKVEI